ncbi:hypothetical protein [Rickettsiella endosymbiont of Rhagonycha lignosa]|uniref:hypothetical protein n=1 Tax=Rickettsiella endosymbiont of Rhagonycha lignosa TaxID=3077937 RepID=UPI00313D8F61
MLLRQKNLTDVILLHDNELHQLIMIQEQRLQQWITIGITYKEVLFFPRLLPIISTIFLGFAAVAVAFAAVSATLVIISTLLFLSYFASCFISGFYYGLASLPCCSTLDETLAILKKFDVSAHHSIPIPKTLTDKDFSKNYSESKKTQYSPSLFLIASTSTTPQDFDSVIKSENTLQYKN